MFPDTQNNNGGQPAQPQYQPGTGVNSAPFQAPNGQYEVLPPLPVSGNTGHSGHNPYEFIVNPNTQHRSSMFGGGNNLLLRVAVAGGGLIVLLIIAAVVLSALKPKSSVPALVSIAQRQQEIIRVATQATTQATGQDTQIFVANVVLSVTSSQQQTVDYVTTHGQKLGNKLLALDQSAQTDTLLANATTANNYDTAVVQSLTASLQTYEDQLNTAYKAASGKTAKALLQNSFASAEALVTEAKRLPANASS